MLTHEQERATTAPGHVGVIAGAGTGKTHMLAERYVHHLKQGLTPLQVVSVTYTDRAAQELRARIRKRVLQEFPGNLEVQAELEAAQISTLHGLCARICHEHAHLLKIPPDFTIIDALDRTLRQNRWLNTALMNLPEETFDDLSYSQLRQHMNTLLADPVKAQLAFDSTASWTEQLHQLQIQVWQEALQTTSLKSALQVIQDLQGKAGDKMEEAQQQVLQGLQQAQEGNLLETQRLLSSFSLQGGKQDCWGGKANLDAIKAALKTVKETFKDHPLLSLSPQECDSRAEQHLGLLKSIFIQVKETIRHLKHQEKVLDFNDLEIHALAALKFGSVQKHYQRRWKAILLDEVQDTNLTQVELVRALGDHLQVTVVGDPQQSIYSFRGARLDVFNAYQQELRVRGGMQVKLTETFRAHQELANTINRYASSVFPNPHPLHGSRPAPTAGPHLYQRTVVVPKGSAVSKPRRQIAEARAIASTLTDLISQGTPVFDRHLQTTRPMAWGDVAILTRAWAPHTVYHDVFYAAGIPCIQAGGGNLLETTEGQDAISMLSFLADPYNDLALVAVLRSPFFAVSDPLLYQLQTQKTTPRQPWWNVLNGSTLPQLKEAHRTLLDLLNQRESSSPAHLLRLADRLTGYTAVLSQLPGAARRTADWKGAQELVERLQGHAQNLLDVMQFIQLLQQHEVEVPRTKLDAAQAVTLMTLHSSKGLQWPVVVLADLDYRAPKNMVPDLLMDETIGVGLKTLQEGEWQDSSKYMALKSLRSAQEKEELKRLIYVGLTRAQDCVLATSTAPSGEAYELLKTALGTEAWSQQDILFEPAMAVF